MANESRDLPELLVDFKQHPPKNITISPKLDSFHKLGSCWYWMIVLVEFDGKVHSRIENEAVRALDRRIE